MKAEEQPPVAKVYDYVDKLIENINTESDQCLNDGAEDIAMLLAEASKALKQMADTLWDIAVWKPHHDSKAHGETYYEIRAKHCLKNLGK